MVAQTQKQNKMEKPRYFDMLADYLASQTEQELENRLKEITEELF